jgi:hypothetical protein
MPGTRRTPIRRPPGPRITEYSIDLFERGSKLLQRRPSPEVERELAEVSVALHSALGLAVWDEDVFDCDTRTPPPFLATESERDSWFRSRALREQLVSALNQRRKAKREERRRARQVAASLSSPSSGQPPEQPHAREARADVETIGKPTANGLAVGGTAPASPAR